MNQKLLEKLAKLKAQAESEKAIGNEEAAQAFAAMFQDILIRHKLDMSDVEAVNLEVEEPVGRHTIDYDKYPEVPLKRTRDKATEKLADACAYAYFCRAMYYTRSSRITFVGRKSDCELAEYMYITLVRALDSISRKAYADFTVECVNQCGICRRSKASCTGRWHTFEPNWARARGFRASFVDQFINRLAYRFWEVRNKAEQANPGALVRLNNADKAIDKWMADNKVKVEKDDEKQNDKWKRRDGNIEGRRRGHAAADQVNLDPKVLTKTAAEKKYLP